MISSKLSSSTLYNKYVNKKDDEIVMGKCAYDDVDELTSNGLGMLSNS